jgi:hypothetical protein
MRPTHASRLRAHHTLLNQEIPDPKPAAWPTGAANFQVTTPSPDPLEIGWCLSFKIDVRSHSCRTLWYA